MSTPVDPPAIISPAPAWAERLTAFVAAALERGDLAGSSDPLGEYLVRLMLAEPAESRIAVDGDAIVGLVAPDPKALVVAPDRRRQGLGRRLVEAGLAVEAARGRGLILGPPPGRPEAIAFLEATGFLFHSTLWELVLAAERTLRPPAWPEDVIARTPDPARDVVAWDRLWNAAFADHPTPIASDPAAVERWWQEQPDELAHAIVLEPRDDPASLVGLCATIPRRRDGAIWLAEVAFVAVAPDRRGQGLGAALLGWGVEHLRALGAGPVELSVNARNAGALRIYERAGFAPTASRERWERRI